MFIKQRILSFLIAAALIAATFGLGRAVFAAGRTVNVSTAAQLTAALQNAQPGDVIQLADGTYSGFFASSVTGTQSSPITLQGSRNAIINGGGTTPPGTPPPPYAYGLHLTNVQYWHLVGFTVTNAPKGIVLDKSSYNVIDGVKVYNIGDEAIHLRDFSTHNTVQNCDVSQTGVYAPGYGEGIYLGTAQSNWGTYSGGQPDNSDYNQVLNNHLGPSIAAEGVDIKEATTGGLIDGNYFDSAGLSGANSADSWVDVKGNHYVLSNNTGLKALQDGFQVHSVLSGWGDYNSFWNNNINPEVPGYGFWIQSGTTGNIVYDNNVVANATSGIANIALTKSSSATSTPSTGATATHTTIAPSATNTKTPTFVPPTNTKTATTIAATNTNTPVPSSTAISATATNTATSAPTKTSTTVPPTSTSTATAIATTGDATLHLQYQNGNTTTTGNNIKPQFQIVNAGTSGVTLSNLTIRYWFTSDGGASTFSTYCDYATLNCANVTVKVVAVSPTRSGADHYLEVSFTAGAGSLAAGGKTGAIKARANKTDWSTLDETNDYSHGTQSSFADWSKVTLYQNGSLVWGIEP